MSMEWSVPDEEITFRVRLSHRNMCNTVIGHPRVEDREDGNRSAGSLRISSLPSLRNADPKEIATVPLREPIPDSIVSEPPRGGYDGGSTGNSKQTTVQDPYVQVRVMASEVSIDQPVWERWLADSQEWPHKNLSSRLFRQPVLGRLSACCAVLFGALGVHLLVSAASMFEVRIGYSSTDSYMLLEIPEDITDTVWMSYEIPDFYVNHRAFVESKDNFLLGGGFLALSGYVCVEFRDHGRGQVASPRPVFLVFDGGFEQHVQAVGLAAMSIFSDDFDLVRVSDGVNIALDQRDLALPRDSEGLDKKILPVSDGSGGVAFSIDGHSSWLPDATFVEHFKVWYRGSPSPHVRHLWATIPEGLQSGSYEIRIRVNSPVWETRWRVPEKRVILTRQHAYGSPGASSLLGLLCLLIASAELIFTCILWAKSRSC
eukprot:CAMPEP_0170593780 /NCGR_PEP_ID=MMETSP0224-20130122/13642_1 /TAXON_ID=285029 /ORGANISM="Togula jolla, Strain CCCM 725" /LENGTH=428 /DNA_ID=CAMNT_0010917779 /DNA_START=96 /DNA_END=1384 /DNA_ORIENTATION=+